MERLVVQRYRLESSVGQGGMGVVWRARDEVLGRDVAVKELLLPTALSDAERERAYRRTLREARSAAQLSHPNVVTVHDVVEEDGRPWIVMELLRARSLQEVIDKEGPLPPERAAGIARQIVAALDAAHAVGVLHRDVKPSNVLLAADDRVVLTDFGISTVQGDAALTQTGQMLGSPGYIAPERLRGQQTMPASDLWSLGVTLYAAVEGRQPFERPDAMSTLAAVLTIDPAPPVSAGPLGPVIEGLLHKDPGERLTTTKATAMLASAAVTTATNTAATIQVAAVPNGRTHRVPRAMAMSPAATPDASSLPVGPVTRSMAGLSAYASGGAALVATLFGLLALVRTHFPADKPPVGLWFQIWMFAGLVLALVTHVPVVLSDAIGANRPKLRVAGLVGAGACLLHLGVISVIGWAGYEMSDQVIDDYAFSISGVIWGVWLATAGVFTWARSRAAAAAALIGGVAHVLWSVMLPWQAGTSVYAEYGQGFIEQLQSLGFAFLIPASMVGYVMWAGLIGRWLRNR